jgi:hypothetical protein
VVTGTEGGNEVSGLDTKLVSALYRVIKHNLGGGLFCEQNNLQVHM